MKSKLRLNASGFSIIYSTPPFANTMLAEVFYSNSLLEKLEIL
ncbi:hypothetical protein SAMN04489756_1175 [Cloacibacterium normanense]|nr:hypothetical protein SAMN04489756_1175 [Cloacibacterium normanense]